MDDKKAANILTNLLNKFPFDDGEKEAVETAIGTLCWTS
jgi:hypothetical protein